MEVCIFPDASRSELQDFFNFIMLFMFDATEFTSMMLGCLPW